MPSVLRGSWLALLICLLACPASLAQASIHQYSGHSGAQSKEQPEGPDSDAILRGPLQPRLDSTPLRVAPPEVAPLETPPAESGGTVSPETVPAGVPLSRPVRTEPYIPPSAPSPRLGPLQSPTTAVPDTNPAGDPVPSFPSLNIPRDFQYTDTLLTPEQRAQSKSIPLQPVPQNQLVPIAGGRLPPIRLEASYNQPIGLRDVLEIALNNSLPIKISQAGYQSQRYLFYSALGRFLPDLNMVYRDQRLMTQGNRPIDTSTYSTTLRFPVFQGGRILFGSLVNLHRMRSARYAYSATINDTLLDVFRRYNDVLLNEVLMQIRLRSVEVSRAQLRLNQQLRDAGTGTNFAVMQSTTQLALDKQALLQQQVAVRQSALQLAYALNLNVAINLRPEERCVTETRLIDPTLTAAQLSTIAMRTRPDLAQFNETRLAQARNVPLTAAPLFPTVQFFLSANRSETNRGAGGGQVGANNLGTLTGTGQSGTGVGGTGIQGVGAAGIGGAASTTVIPAGGGGGTGIAVGGGANESFTAGFDINWNLQGLGVPDTFNVLSARALARQALLQYNQQALNVLTQVRTSYLNSLAAEEQVDVAAEAVISSEEGLRLARLRLQHGAGTNLELIQAQRDYVQALINQAQAIINFNIAQAQLLRDIGTISVPTLTAQLNRPISAQPIKTNLLQ